MIRLSKELLLTVINFFSRTVKVIFILQNARTKYLKAYSKKDSIKN